MTYDAYFFNAYSRVTDVLLTLFNLKVGTSIDLQTTVSM